MKEYKRKDRHATEPDPSKLQPRSKRKPGPRYVVQRWWKPWFVGREGHWGQIAACRTLEEAEHQMRKPLREFYLWRAKPVEVRIIDTTDGSVVHTETLPPKKR